MADIEIEIDGQKLTAEPNQMVIQVADAAGIYIPRFCYHKKLSIAANCRMCLVEVEKSPKALPACATPVMPGMKVFTKSAKTVAAQRAVMEFLLVNHPLDCPICDQGGECELQDLSMGYGSSQSHYDETKRSIADENLGPLIATDMTRCIYCTRCVRFGSEIAGMRELGGTYRGEDTQIGTFVEHAVQSEVSGNVIDLCPVGALTSKPFRFRARAWELEQYPSISPHDALGTNINVHTRYGKVMRVVPRENAAINETWIADRDRYSYEGLYHADRLEEPVLNINGEKQVADWQTALQFAADGLHQTISAHGADKLGALASPNSTVEEFYLLQKLIRGLGSQHIDHRLQEKDTRDQTQFAAFPGLSMPIEQLSTCDAILIIGSNLRKEQPLLALKVRQASLKGAAVSVINAVDYDFNFAVQSKAIVAPHYTYHILQQLHEKLINSAATVSEAATQLATSLTDKKQIAIMLGAEVMHADDAACIRMLSKKLASKLNATVSYLTDGGNSAGAWLAGAIPHRYPGGATINDHGLSAYQMLEKPRKAYVLLNIEPELDFANTQHALEAIKQADFVVAFSMYRNPILEQYADVILPIAAFTETAGTYVNTSGTWQSVQGVASAFGNARPAWKVLRVLGNFMHVDGFLYETVEEVRRELENIIAKMPVTSMQAALHMVDEKTDCEQLQAAKYTAQMLSRIGEIPLYAIDPIVRRAEPLQAAQRYMVGDTFTVRLHGNTAAKLKLAAQEVVLVKQDKMAMQLPVTIDDSVAEDAVWLAGGIRFNEPLGDLMGPIHLEKIN